MGNKVTFDPVTKIIQVDEAPVLVDGDWVVNLDIKVDLFSDGKEDWLADPTLSKLIFPLRSVGGDPLPGSKSLGSTFFLDSNWKIRPYEASHVFAVNGNFYSEDGTSPYTQTVGTYNVMLINAVSSLVDSTVQQLQEIEYGTFQNAVWIDVNSDHTGTIYPTGNREHPVNNAADAVLIANDKGFDTLNVLGNYTFGAGDNINNFTVVGQNPVKSIITVETEALAYGVEFFECHLKGILDGGSVARECMITDLNYINGFVYNCIISPGVISLGGPPSSVAHFLQCYSGQPGLSTPIIDCAGDGPALAIRGYNGGIQLINKTGTAAVSVDFAAGQLKLDSTVTNGDIVARGDGKITDADTGEFIHTGLYNGANIYNELNNGIHAHDIWQLLGLDIQNPVDGSVANVVTVGNITLNITDNGDGTGTVTRV